MPRQRLLFTVGNLMRGGAEKQLVTMLRYLPGECFEIAVVNFSREKDDYWVPAICDLPVEYFQADTNAGHSGRMVALGKIVHGMRPHTIWAWHFFTGVYVSMLKLAGYRYRHVQGVRSTLGYLRQVHRWAPALLKRSDLVVANSRATIEDIANLGIAGNRLAVLPNAIDTGGSAVPGLRDEVSHIGMCCNLHARKGIDVFLMAVKMLLERFPDLHVSIDGAGDATPYARLARTLGVEDRVRFGGAVSCQERLGEFDLFVLPSRHEGIPNVLMEAMVLGVPSVACDVGGVRELVGESGACCMVPSEDPRRLHDAIADLISSREARERMSAAALERVKAFRPEVIYGERAVELLRP